MPEDPETAWATVLRTELAPFLTTLAPYPTPRQTPRSLVKYVTAQFKSFFRARFVALAACGNGAAVIAVYLDGSAQRTTLIKWLKDKQRECRFDRFKEPHLCYIRLCEDMFWGLFTRPAVEIVREVAFDSIKKLKTTEMPDVSPFRMVAETLNNVQHADPLFYQHTWHKHILQCFYNTFCIAQGSWFLDGALAELDNSLTTAMDYVEQFCPNDKIALTAKEELRAMVSLRAYAIARDSLKNPRADVATILTRGSTTELASMYKECNGLEHLSFLRDVIQRVQKVKDVKNVTEKLQETWTDSKWFSEGALTIMNYEMYKVSRRVREMFSGLPIRESSGMDVYSWICCKKELDMWETLRDIAQEHFQKEVEQDNSEFREILAAGDSDDIEAMYIELVHLTCMPRIVAWVQFHDLKQKLEDVWDRFLGAMSMNVWMDASFLSRTDADIQRIIMQTRSRVPFFQREGDCRECSPTTNTWSVLHPQHSFHTKVWYNAHIRIQEKLQNEFAHRWAYFLFAGQHHELRINIRDAPSQEIRRFMRGLASTSTLTFVQNYILRDAVDSALREVWDVVNAESERWFPGVSSSRVSNLVQDIMYYSDKWYEYACDMGSDGILRGSLSRSPESERCLDTFQEVILKKLQALTEDPNSIVSQAFERDNYIQINHLYSVCDVLAMNHVDFKRSLRKTLLKCEVDIRSKKVFSLIPRLTEQWIQVTNLLYFDYQGHALSTEVLDHCRGDDELYRFAINLLQITIENKIDDGGQLEAAFEARFRKMKDIERLQFAQTCAKFGGLRELLSWMVLKADIKTTGERVRRKFGDITGLCPREMQNLSQIQLIPLELEETTFHVLRELFSDLGELQRRIRAAMGRGEKQEVLESLMDKQVSRVLNSTQWGGKEGLLKLAFHYINGLMNEEVKFVDSRKVPAYFHQVSGVLSLLAVPSALETICARHLQHRLLVHDQRWTSSAHMYVFEKYFVQCLEEEMGPTFVAKMKAMIENVDEKIRDYQFNIGEHVQITGAQQIANCRVTLLNKANWRDVPMELFDLPPQLSTLLSSFKHEMLMEESKKYDFLHNIGEVVLEVAFDVNGESRLVEVKGGILQSSILLTLAANSTMLFQELEDELLVKGIPRNSGKLDSTRVKLYAALKAILVSDLGIISKDPLSGQIAATDRLSISTVNYDSAMISLPRYKAWMELEGRALIAKQKSTETGVLDASWSIEASRAELMKILKRSEEMKTQEMLQTAIRNLLGNVRIAGDETEFMKKQLDWLVDNEYIEYKKSDREEDREVVVYVR